MPQLGQLATRSWWAEVAEAAVRQNLQILAPFLALVAASGTFTSDAALATALAFVVAVASVILFRVARVAPPPGAHLAVQVAYRAISAFAASVAAAFAADGFDLLDAHPGHVLEAAAASALLALVHWKADPPASRVIAGEVLSTRDTRPLGDPPVRMEFTAGDPDSLRAAVQGELRRIRGTDPR
jgi:hypothetical protein